MTHFPKLLLATVAATAVAVPTALAKDGFHLYSYGNAKLGLSVQLVRAEGSREVSGSITQQCAGPDDQALSLTSNLVGKLKNEKINLKGDFPDEGPGTSQIKGKMTLKKFKGLVKLSVPIDGAGTCKVSKKFSAKHTFTTGG